MSHPQTAPSGRAGQDAILGFIGRLDGHVGSLDGALVSWADRDDTRAEPGVREAASTAMGAIDAMLRELHTLRGALVSEIRASDDATDARVDALLARRQPRADADPDAWAFT